MVFSAEASFGEENFVLVAFCGGSAFLLAALCGDAAVLLETFCGEPFLLVDLCGEAFAGDGVCLCDDVWVARDSVRFTCLESYCARAFNMPFGRRNV